MSALPPRYQLPRLPPQKELAKRQIAAHQDHDGQACTPVLIGGRFFGVRTGESHRHVEQMDGEVRGRFTTSVPQCITRSLARLDQQLQPGERS
jgi:hypothetical protein